MRDRFEDDLVVWVQPSRIKHYVGKSVPLLGGVDKVAWRVPATLRRRLARFVRRVRPSRDGPFFIPAAHYRHPMPIELLEKYTIVADLIACRDTYIRSIWFNELRRSLERHGTAKHKSIEMRTIEDVHAFFSGYVLPLVESMARDGYDVTRGHPFGGVIVSADGQLHKANAGDHRFFVARVVGASPVPLRVVGIDERWPRTMGLGCDLASMPAVIEAVQVVGQRYGS